MIAASTEVTRRRSAGVAYACYGFVALYFVTAAALQALYGRPSGPEELARWQGIGMLVLLPLAFAAIAAALVGAKNSLRLLRRWREEPGLAVLPLLLVLLLAAFAAVESGQLGRGLLTWLAGAYVVAACVFLARHAAGRQRP